MRISDFEALPVMKPSDRLKMQKLGIINCQNEKSKYTESQIIKALKENEQGRKAEEFAEN